MKVNIVKDECYPVYSIYGLDSMIEKICNIPVELYDRYVAVTGQYWQVQDELAAIYENSKGHPND